MKIANKIAKLVVIMVAALFAANFHVAKAAEKGYVSFSFDDGLASTYDIAYPILAENNCRATAYITTDWIGVRNFMNWSEVQNLQNEGKWEIGNHTANHDRLWKKKFKTGYIQKDLARSQQAFADHDIRTPVSFAPPYGKWNNRLMDVAVATGFTSSRRAWAVNDASNDPAGINRFALESMNLKRSVPFEKVKAEIDYAVNHNRWLVFTIHRVADGKVKKSDYSAAELRKIAEYANSLQKAGRLEVLPVGEAVSKF